VDVGINGPRPAAFRIHRKAPCLIKRIAHSTQPAQRVVTELGGVAQGIGDVGAIVRVVIAKRQERRTAGR
jgi:hypothetical protein